MFVSLIDIQISILRNLQRILNGSSVYQDIMSSLRACRHERKCSSYLDQSAVDLKYSTSREELDAAIIDLTKAKITFIANLRKEHHKKIMAKVRSIVVNGSKKGFDE